MRFKGKRVVLDGRNRLRACLRMDVKPAWREFEGDSPAHFVVSLNLKRRNLTKSQAVACAVEMLPVFEAEAKARHQAAAERGKLQRGRKEVDSGPQPSVAEGKARDRAANVFGVSGRHVQRAKKLKQTAPQLLDAVKAGKMDLGTAVKASRIDGSLSDVEWVTRWSPRFALNCPIRAVQVALGSAETARFAGCPRRQRPSRPRQRHYPRGRASYQSDDLSSSTRWRSGSMRACRMRTTWTSPASVTW
jgi:hypothetical protein